MRAKWSCCAGPYLTGPWMVIETELLMEFLPSLYLLCLSPRSYMVFDKGVWLVYKLQHGDIIPSQKQVLGHSTCIQGQALKVVYVICCIIRVHFFTGSYDGLGRVWEDYYDANIFMINYNRRDEVDTMVRDNMILQWVKVHDKAMSEITLFCSSRVYYCGNIHISLKYPCSVGIILISQKYQHYVDIICI